MRVLFKLRRNLRNRNADATIYCRIKLDGQHANDFSTFISVLPADWDSGKQRIRGTGTSAHDNNLRLEQTRSDITRLFLQYQSSDIEISAQVLANIYTGKQKVNYTFTELLTLFEEHCKLTYDSKGTKKNYQVRINNIRLFLEEKKHTKLPADRFTLGVADEFVRWAKGRKLDHQYVVRHTQVLKNIMEDAVRREILKFDPLAVFVLKKRHRINVDHLEPEELQHLEQTEWRPTLERIVDLFLFSCYTGLHYDDSQTLQPDEVRPGVDGRMWLFKPRGKYAESKFFAGDLVQIVPLHPKALLLIEKYGGVENLPKISNAKYNEYLKQIAFLAGFKINLTVKIGRKTFTDTVLNELGVSEVAVAAMLGHTDTKMIKHYAKVSHKRIAKEVVWE